MDSKLYPIRVLVTRTEEESDQYLQAYAASHPNTPVLFPHQEVEGINGCTFYLAIDTPELQLYVIHTDERFGREVFDVYSLMEQRKAGIIMYIDGSVLGVVRLSSFHNFPAITFREQNDAMAFFQSAAVGNAPIEIAMCMQQRLDYLLHEQVPASERERKPRRENHHQTRGEPREKPRSNKKVQNGKPKNGNKKNGPRKQNKAPNSYAAKAEATFVPMVVTTGQWHQLGSDE